MLVNSPDLYANMSLQVGVKCLCVPNWKEAFGDTLSKSDFSLGFYTLFVFVPSFLLIILYTIIFVKLKSYAENSRQRIETHQKCNENGRGHCICVYAMSASQTYLVFVGSPCSKFVKLCVSYPLRNCTIFIVFSLFECPPKLFGKTSLN